MALVLADRVQETTTTTGTGTVTLAGAVAGFQSFAVIGDGNTTYYCITSGNNWEVGLGTYSATGPTLLRIGILASSASGAAITLSGTSNVFCVYPASKSVNSDGIDNVPIGLNFRSTGVFLPLEAGAPSDDTAASPIARFNATDIDAASPAPIRCYGYNSNLPSNPGFSLEIGRSRGSVAGELISVNSTSGLGRIAFSGYAAALPWNVAASISATPGTIGSGTLGGNLNLATTPSGGLTPITRLTISQSGQISIGVNAETFGPQLGTTQAAKLNASSGTYTDGGTVASGVAALGPINMFQVATLAAFNSSVTYTDAATVYIAGAPLPGTNVTITNRYALQINSGNTNLGPGAVTAGSLSLTTALPLGSGGTGKTTAPAAQAALMGFTTTATAGGTTALTNTSSVYQIFTGSSAQTITLPSTATLAQGWFFHICNNSTGTLTLQTSTAVSLGTIPPGLTVMASCVDTTVNTAAAWEYGYTDFSTITGTGANVLADSPTITDLMLSAGTATLPPLQFTAGTNLTAAAAGAVEYDGDVFYGTGNTTSGRGYVPSVQLFRLTANGSAITTIANFFGANSAINLAAGGKYEIEAHCYFLKTTAGTATVTITSSLAPANLSGVIQTGAVGGGTAVGAAQQIALYNSTATAAAFGATGSLTSAVNHYMKISLIVDANASASNLRINFTSSAGSITPLRNSYYKVTRLPAGNTGSFAA